jgi:hypothetical protein
MKQILLVMFGLVSIWDMFTTVVGTNKYLGGNSILVPVFVAIAISGFLIGTKRLWQQEGAVGIVVKLFWIVAFGYDVFTSYLGNLNFVLDGDSSKMAFLLGITFITSAAPILISLIFDYQ